jgi:hypothetical protein
MLCSQTIQHDPDLTEVRQGSGQPITAFLYVIIRKSNHVVFIMGNPALNYGYAALLISSSHPFPKILFQLKLPALL